MATLTNARIAYESAQQQYPFAAMTAAADRQTFSLATRPWSNAAGYEYVVAPYGLLTGGAITPESGGANDQVDVAALTAMMPGATGASATTGVLTVAADEDVSITRGTSTNTHCITSITVNSSGAIAAVAGTASTAFSETRGAAGGPPLIPDGSIEIGQVRTTSITAGKITAAEIYQVPGVSQERSDFPVYSVDPIRGQVTFAAALDPIHTGAIPKRVYARVATPIFSAMARCRNWVPAEVTSSVSSEDYYDGPIGSVSSSVGQASFEMVLSDGVTDAILAKDGQDLMFKFWPDYNKSPYQITQGIFRKTRAYGVGANPTMSATISASQATVDFAS